MWARGDLELAGLFFLSILNLETFLTLDRLFLKHFLTSTGLTLISIALQVSFLESSLQFQVRNKILVPRQVAHE